MGTPFMGNEDRVACPSKGEAMLRLVLLVLYLTAVCSSGPAKSGGYDFGGLTAQPQPTADTGGGWDPNG